MFDSRGRGGERKRAREKELARARESGRRGSEGVRDQVRAVSRVSGELECIVYLSVQNIRQLLRIMASPLPHSNRSLLTL